MASLEEKKIVFLKNIILKKKIKIKLLKNYHDEKNLNEILKINFDEIYFCGGQSNVKKSFVEKENETYLSQIKPIKIILEYIRLQKEKKQNFYFFASGEIFGIQKNKRLNEKSEKNPVSPYGLSKLASFEIIRSYREMFNIPVCSVILFNHESFLRKKDFVIMKTISFVQNLSQNEKKILKLGNLNISRDWGWAPEYMRGCVKIMSLKKLDDFILATGKTITLKYVIKEIFQLKGLNWKQYVKIDKKNFRPLESKKNFSDITKLKKIKMVPKSENKRNFKKKFITIKDNEYINNRCYRFYWL